MKKPIENIEWIDLLRVLACFLVVMAHACIPPYLQIPLIAVFGFSVSALLIRIFSMISFLKRFVL